jgi:hypothetical protein
MSASVSHELFTEPARSWDITGQQADRVRDRVDTLTAADLNARPTESIVDELSRRYSLDIPVLNTQAATARHEEADIIVGRRPFGGPRTVRGSRVTIGVPFEGDAKLFELRPDTYEDLPAVRGTVEGAHLLFTVEGEHLTAEEVRAAFESWLSLVNRHLELHREKLGGFNEGLHPLVTRAVEDRIARLRAHAELLRELGLPVAA